MFSITLKTLAALGHMNYYIIFSARDNLRSHSHLLGLYAFPRSLMLTAAFRGHCHLPHDKYPLLWNICKIIFPCLLLSLPCLPFPEYSMTLWNRRDTAQADCSLSYPILKSASTLSTICTLNCKNLQILDTETT